MSYWYLLLYYLLFEFNSVLWMFYISNICQLICQFLVPWYAVVHISTFFSGIWLLQDVLLMSFKWCGYVAATNGLLTPFKWFGCAAAMNCFVDVISMIFCLSNTLQLNCEFFILWWLQPHFYAFLLCCGYKIFSWQHLTLRKIYQQKTLSLSCHANSH